VLPFELRSESGDSCQQFNVVPEDFHRYHSPLPSGKTIDRVKRGGFAGVGEVEPDLGPPAALNAPGNYDSREKKKRSEEAVLYD
jgi:hypothetical protein